MILLNYQNIYIGNSSLMSNNVTKNFNIFSNLNNYILCNYFYSSTKFIFRSVSIAKFLDTSAKLFFRINKENIFIIQIRELINQLKTEAPFSSNLRIVCSFVNSKLREE